MKDKLIGNENDIIFYTDDEGKTKVEVIVQNEDVWLNTQAIADLFDVNDKAIYKHISNIYKQEELEENSTFSILESIGNNGHVYKTKYYNLDMIISIGYRVNSKKAVKFRKWANKIIKEYMIQGFALDEDRFIKGRKRDLKYFQRLLEKIKLIRTSERMFYQKITDIFAECSIDYTKDSEIAKNFYASIQNKFHYAITQHTAAEIIYDRADSKKKYMVLTTWKDSPNGKILKEDVSIAKNYLTEKELNDLNDIVNIFLDIAENRAKRQITMTMQDWVKRVDLVLETNDYEVLKNNGKISALEAREKAEKEYEKYKVIQDKEFLSDFDLLMLQTENISKIGEKNETRN